MTFDAKKMFLDIVRQVFFFYRKEKNSCAMKKMK